MDPLHPILPQPPNIPPVLPSPRTGRIDRDTPRNEADKERERERRRRAAAAELDGQDDDDETRPHVDVTA